MLARVAKGSERSAANEGSKGSEERWECGEKGARERKERRGEGSLVSERLAALLAEMDDGARD